MLTHIRGRAQQPKSPENPIPFQVTPKGQRAALGRRWDCTDHGPLTVAEANDVLITHGSCGAECRIGRTARRVRALFIDAPTVRASVARPKQFQR